MIDIETYLLNTLLWYPEEIPEAALLVQPDDFIQGAHATVYGELLAMTTNGIPVDLATLSASMARSGTLASVGGDAFLMELQGEISGGAALVPEHARGVREASKRRAMRKGLLVALEALEDPTRPVVDVAGLAEAAAMAGLGGAESTEKMVWQYLPEVFSVMERQSKGEITGLKTGFCDLDLHMSGFQKSDLIVLGGRPRMGKTTLATDIAGNVAIEQGKSVAFFSLEMAGRQIVERHLFTRAKVNGQMLRKGKLPQREFPKIAEASGQFGKGVKWMIDGGTSLSPLQLLSKCRRHRMKFGLDLIVIDNIQKMRSDTREKDRRVEIGEVSKALKIIAKDLDVPVLAISHLNRGPDHRSDPEPVLSDLHESGNIEQDADIVLFVYRESEYKDVEAGKENETKLIFAKYRNGEGGCHTLLHFNKELCSFENWAGNRQAPPESYKKRQAASHGEFYG
jgi:replicative DNA helicase